jgi:hypothetical protein
MVHSTARRPPYGRPETSRLLKVNHCMLHLRILMRSCGCVASRQDTDYTGGWSGVWAPGPTIEGTACLTQVCVQGDLKAFIYGQARRVLETTFFGYRGV